MSSCPPLPPCPIRRPAPHAADAFVRWSYRGTIIMCRRARRPPFAIFSSPSSQLQSWQQGQHAMQIFPSPNGDPSAAGGMAAQQVLAAGAGGSAGGAGGGGFSASSNTHQAFPSAMAQARQVRVYLFCIRFVLFCCIMGVVRVFALERTYFFFTFLYFFFCLVLCAGRSSCVCLCGILLRAGCICTMIVCTRTRV